MSGMSGIACAGVSLASFFFLILLAGSLAHRSCFCAWRSSVAAELVQDHRTNKEASLDPDRVMVALLLWHSHSHFVSQ